MSINKAKQRKLFLFLETDTIITIKQNIFSKCSSFIFSVGVDSSTPVQNHIPWSLKGFQLKQCPCQGIETRALDPMSSLVYVPYRVSGKFFPLPQSLDHQWIRFSEGSWLSINCQGALNFLPMEWDTATWKEKGRIGVMKKP